MKNKHFYIRAKVTEKQKHPWENAIAYGKDGYARIPIGSGAIGLVDDDPKALAFTFSFLSPNDNFSYNTARNIVVGRIKANKFLVLEKESFEKMIINEERFDELFKGFNHKYKKFIDPGLFMVSLRAAYKKLNQTDNETV